MYIQRLLFLSRRFCSPTRSFGRGIVCLGMLLCAYCALAEENAFAETGLSDSFALGQRALLGLVCCFAALGVIVAFLRRFGGGIQTANADIKIRSQTMLTNKTRLFLVDVAGVNYVITVGGEQTTVKQMEGRNAKDMQEIMMCGSSSPSELPSIGAAL